MARTVSNIKQWKELAQTAHYCAGELARLCDLSLRQLQRQFRRNIGRSPQVWLDEQRLVIAQELLLSGLPVKKVAFDLGFKQASHFCRKFKAQNKMTPSQFTASSPRL